MAFARDVDPAAESETQAVASRSEKAATFCNPLGYYCSGTWSDLIDHLVTEADGRVSIFVTAALQEELQTKGFCTLVSDWFIRVRYSGGDTVVLDQLYITYALDKRLVLRLANNNGTCEIAYIRALYRE